MLMDGRVHEAAFRGGVERVVLGVGNGHARSGAEQRFS
jgi:hypothetical protein